MNDKGLGVVEILMIGVVAVLIVLWIVRIL